MLLKKIPLNIYIIFITFLLLSTYTFNAKLDLNGDNASYYIFAKSLATGHGYSDLSAPGNPPSSTFPPGYSLLMAPIFWITDSIEVQNYYGEIFLLASVILLYFFIATSLKNKGLALFTSSIILSNFFILQFATMMMSELPYMLFSIGVLWYLLKVNEQSKTNKFDFILLILITVFAYHIRTQGVVLLLAIVIHFLLNKKWKNAIFTILGFALGSLPWILRNKFLKLEGSRYLTQIMLTDQLDPEKGTLPIAEVIARIIGQSWDIITKELPRTIYSYFIEDYANNIFYPILGVILFIIILYGSWKFIKLRWFFVSFVIGNILIMGIWSGKGFENRYLICILPILLFCFYYGITSIFQQIFKNVIKSNLVWIPASIIMLLVQFKDIKFLHDWNIEQYPETYANFFNVAEWAKNNIPEKSIVSVRKPALFYVYSNRKSVNYLYSEDTKKVIEDMVKSKVDYVIVDALEYSTTYKFLIPAIKKHSNQFRESYSIGNPAFFLLQFDKQLPR